MLHLARKLSQSSSASNTFSVFEDSQDEFDIIDKRNAEVQTDKDNLVDSCENTALSIPFDLESSQNHELSFWSTAAKMKVAELNRIREENDQIQQEIQQNIILKNEKLEEYEKLFVAAAALLEGDENTEEDGTTNSNN
ncbi:unnamed protein product [Auanema sp. JU1783]|nr:unnamed protein product [Auanema sp. JU1783]